MELVAKVAEAAEVTKKDAEKAVNATFATNSILFKLNPS